MTETIVHLENSQHVHPALRGGWAVRPHGAARASKLFKTKDAAVRYARKRAKETAGQLIVHGSDFAVDRQESYAKTAVNG